MILHWAQLVLHYGPAIDAHRSRFEVAGQTDSQMPRKA